MPKVTFVHPDGCRETVEGDSGVSIMQLATSKRIGGIIGECGGAAMCTTCHVFVDPAHVESTGNPNEIEDEMLEVTATERQTTSRLGCQIVLTDQMDGLVLHLPETQ
ncbi:2Fe-2S iron-sulfur cluster-binding protein [Oricola sp.]|uniref:2Fe-2S iron-sulfur cluster-binding protein n=1 Tax=Oricola sp. TaxID=1979950 RepID=UPI003BADB0E9